MSFVIVTAVAFSGGLICGKIDDWRIWAPLTLATGFAVAVTGKVLGVA